MKKIVILFSGDGFNAQNIVKKLHEKECFVVCGITNKKDAKGLDKLQELSVKTEVLEHLNFNSREEFDEELVKLVNSYEPDLVVLSGFMRILSDVFTSNVKAINLHPSLLPKFKGARAIERSFESHDTECGVSVHYVSSELDGGNVILQKSFKKEDNETLESFSAKIKNIEYEIMPQAIVEVLRD
ncbi:phosphoribosylglycinamide formyltransferase [Sulfurimonas gotlandica GD1]|uniref:Phosphoribosylglycinamide formyltransferase n=1 Tax=Sulfurimonas gotlandica (strain DSM 19862 / JCM 16533 / GD1) TaxID=929558 RepID=B6BGA9_SULGG|nr:phosphoribosylglycinamide formyltransferase [Sulfurimonas gotlandica]EDZ63440.1 phosphoribosylglycinamide formyltransferase [Sulfurimonas gotlandica GD1]EHP29535.1 phosphoribosylglycinamide formyltransferase [Sulfurimonas gotlandica GD1]